MKRHFQYSDEQKNMLISMDIPFDFENVDEENLSELEDRVSDYMIYHFVDENDELTKEGLICESILDIVTDY